MSGGSDNDATLSWFSRFGSVSLERRRVFARRVKGAANMFRSFCLVLKS